MTAFQGSLHDGRTATAIPVDVVREGEDLIIRTAQAETRVLLREVRADAPLLGVARTLTLPDGKQITTDEQIAVNELLPTRAWIDRGAYYLESHWPTAIGSVAIIVGAAWLFIQVLLPLAAAPVARMIDPRAEQIIGAQTLKSLDTAAVLKPSRVPEDRQEQIKERFHAFVADEPDANLLDLKFRSGPLGPNAFALPGGIVVVTDDMIKLVSDDQLMAVLAHEIGHVRGKHAVRSILQSSGVLLLMTALAGDAVAVTVLAAAMPAALLQARYSRQFELEADDYAFADLKRHGYSPQLFADAMLRMQKAEHDGEAGGVFKYFSTHPATDERIQRAEAQR